MYLIVYYCTVYHLDNHKNDLSFRILCTFNVSDKNVQKTQLPYWHLTLFKVKTLLKV